MRDSRRSTTQRNGNTNGHQNEESRSPATIGSGQSRGRRRGERRPPSWWNLWLFLLLLALDTVCSIVFLTPLVSRVENMEDLTKSHYTIYGTLWDLSILAVPRILSALCAVLLSYHRRDSPNETPFSLFHKNGDRKSKAELEAEALEEPFAPMIKRYVFRLPFVCETSVLLTGLLAGIKALARLNVEIGVFGDAKPEHPMFWVALGFTGFFSLLESVYVASAENLAGELGRHRRNELQQSNASALWVERISESLAQPLLSRPSSEADIEGLLDSGADEEQGGQTRGSRQGLGVDERGRSDIGADAEYNASWKDLMAICAPDRYLVLLASLFLLAGSICNIYVPKFTGAVLDALVSRDTDGAALSLDMFRDGSITHIPGFVKNIERLVLVSVLGGVFGGIRGTIFTLIGARVNTRLRIRLMDSLLSQDIGFYDTTRTGDITSRLSSDTTLVGSSITTNVNVFLRSTVRATGVLVFMFIISWKLSLLAFITIPAVSVLSKWYGRYIRKLTKLQQKKLAEGNTVSQATISSMPTVRAFGSEGVELSEFEECMQNYLSLNIRAAVATFGYTACVNALPQLVKALVLFYGGLLVLSDGADNISGGQLVSFILYLTSLSEAFNSLGGIYASLVRAVAASDKVFELMHREPRITVPSHVDEERMADAIERKRKHLLGVDATKVVEQRARGLYPDSCDGEITFQDVEYRYPARPQRAVLNGMDLTIPAGSIVALVGVSGGGKSSCVKLVQHLYEPSKGKVMIDGIPVEQLSHDWISRHVAVVSQEPTLYARSVKRNILYGLEGDNEPSQEEIEEAARLANAAGFIEALPQGYDTDVGERGIQLSGGQKQRIAIARAIVRKPKVLLLDEATSALDSESEFVVQKAIDDMISGQRSLDGDPSRSMTVVIIAHRLSTVRNADCIFVLQEGKVVEKGSHSELVASDGVYNGLIRRQLGQTDDSPGQTDDSPGLA